MTDTLLKAVDGGTIKEASFNWDTEKKLAVNISQRDEILFRLLERIERAILSK